MARKNVEGQEVMPFAEDTPEMKQAKKLIKEYDKMKKGFQAQHSTDRETLDKKQAKMVEAVQLSGYKADSEGVFHVVIDDYIWDVWQDASFKTKRRKNKEADGELPEEEVDDDE